MFELLRLEPRVSMTVVVKSKTDLVVPRSVRRRAGIRAGDQIEFKVSGRVINIIPKLPSAAADYTSDERRVIDARLAESEEDLKAVRSFGPFDTAEAMIASMKAEMKKRAAGAKSKRLK